MTDIKLAPRIDASTVVALALLLMPLLTMWHEIGGHAATCAVLGGRVKEIGAFYVDCDGLTGARQVAVSLAGVTVDALLATVAHAVWRQARGDLARLILWYVWVMKAQVAAGYFLFSGVSNFGDLGFGTNGGLHALGLAGGWRIAETAVGGLAYFAIVVAAIRALNTMLGDDPATNPARRRIAHLFYGVIGVAAVVVGLFNPIGIVITIMSAAASSFGGNAGFISIGYAGGRGSVVRPFEVARSWPLLASGIVTTLLFAVAFGSTLRLG